MNTIPKVCSKEDCDRGGKITKGFCAMHYARTLPKPIRPLGYQCWCAMVERCYNPHAKAYPRYGAQGITVCDRWRGKGGYYRMVEDIGERPSRDYSLDRIDPTGNYEPSNVRWAEWFQQAINRRRTLGGISYLGNQNAKRKWRARLSYRRKMVLNKTFNTYEEARSARDEAEREYYSRYKVTG